jgi:hypothetical protein
MVSCASRAGIDLDMVIVMKKTLLLLCSLIEYLTH